MFVTISELMQRSVEKTSPYDAVTCAIAISSYFLGIALTTTRDHARPRVVSKHLWQNRWNFATTQEHSKNST
ncbi:hypothetical protein Y032_0707g1706 [Ancylostoma ceylanicum]|uniref:Uncharacterized protein n=1 Tax=Ancylostoma ceylanicum TaxID=53326 RepID=A0A016WFM4_9BILA|nr:hypothetical protein Y032_0707g1706 [Ancylostoma ceylanicum]